MKRSLALLLSSLLLAFSLTACGRDQQADNGGNAAGNGSTANGGTTAGNENAANGGVTAGSTANGGTTSGTGNGSPNNGGTGNANNGGTGSAANGSLAGDAANSVQNGLNNAGNAIQNGMDDLTGGTAGTTRARVGAGYQQMLRNARVHDRDGDLTDGENAVTPGSAL